MKTYSEKFKDPRWQRKRLEIMERDGFKCQQCDDSKRTLNVHHEYYVQGRSPWEYPTWSLLTLCANCHQNQHADDLDRKENAKKARPWEEIVGFLSGGSMDEFESWWDISTMLAMRKEEFQKRGIRAIDWMMWACEEMRRLEFLANIPKEQCVACLDPFPARRTSPAHTCKNHQK